MPTKKNARICAAPICLLLALVFFISIGLNLQLGTTQKDYVGNKNDVAIPPSISYDFNHSTKEETDFYNSSHLRGSTTLRTIDLSTLVEPTDNSTVPLILWFTYKHNILQAKDPEHLYKNVLKTISSYATVFKEHANNTTRITVATDIQVHFLDDQDCYRVINEAHSELTVHFLNETNGSFKGDMCRSAALYLYGGYYFDVDMELVTPYVVNEATNTSFVSVLSPDKRVFFQSFIASTARNPILQSAFKFMIDYYEGRHDACTRQNRCLVGPQTLMDAYQSVAEGPSGKRSTSTIKTVLLQEAPLFPSLYPAFPRRQGRDIWCNHIVHDPVEQTVYFYSRVEGSQNCPFLKPDANGGARCGGGFVGNGICLDGTCCSPYGWCGTTPQHCGRRRGHHERA